MIFRKPAPQIRLIHRHLYKQYTTNSEPPILKITDGTFYRHHPTTQHPSIQNPPLFPSLNFTIPSTTKSPEYWSILGPSSSGKTTLLQILRGQHLCFPPTARTYPYLSSAKDPSSRIPSRAIQYVGFGGEGGELSGQGTRGAYLSARYESYREVDDWSVLDYLTGNTNLNPDAAMEERVDDQHLQRVIQDLKLTDLVSMPVANLSNGQTRRAKIARALLGKPEVLLLDEPFMGLDPPTLMMLSPLLRGLAEASQPRLVLSLRPQDPIPDWITHLMFLKSGSQVAYSGQKDEVLENVRRDASVAKGGSRNGLAMSLREIGRKLTNKGIIETTRSETLPVQESSPTPTSTTKSEPIVEMSGVKVSYGTKTVLGNWTQLIDNTPQPGLHWTIRRGERWGIFGPNGSGKTTILSLICSDHPKTYSLPILLFGKSRLPEPGKPGISIFDLQLQMGHSSPEIHHFIPRELTLRKVLQNAWAETFLARPKLDAYANVAVDEALRWFEAELRPGFNRNEVTKDDTARETTWADDHLFGSLPFSTQRLTLFIRALIKKPSLVILDEAFSGMDEGVRDKCMSFLHHGTAKSHSPTTTHLKQGVITGLEDRQALLCISHVREEIPGCVREWICLPEANTMRPARFGRLSGEVGADFKGWNEIWGIEEGGS